MVVGLVWNCCQSFTFMPQSSLAVANGIIVSKIVSVIRVAVLVFIVCLYC